MEPLFYPTHQHLFNRYRKVGAEQSGILRSLINNPTRITNSELDTLTLSATIPQYHKLCVAGHASISYHLSGYGLHNEEALIRLMGEAIERYSLVANALPYLPRVVYASYRDISKEGEVIPWEYLHLFSGEDYKKLEKTQYAYLRPLGEDDIVGWVRCPSLLDPGREIWMPMQMLFIGYKAAKMTKGEAPFTMGFSTGTASHTSVEKALLNAILEFIEIDALMINWYTQRKADRVVIDNPEISRAFPWIHDPQAGYELQLLDLTLPDPLQAHTFGCALRNRKEERPFIVYGAQAELNPIKGAYRGIMEALAISVLGFLGPLYTPSLFVRSANPDHFDDLDLNVHFYLNPKNATLKRAILDTTIGDKTKNLSSLPNRSTGNSKEDLMGLIGALKEFSQYAVYLNVTPPEVMELGWSVMRVYIPELVTMCLPGIPYSRHPRLKDRITNDYPHALP